MNLLYEWCSIGFADSTAESRRARKICRLYRIAAAFRALREIDA